MTSWDQNEVNKDWTIQKSNKMPNPRDMKVGNVFTPDQLPNSATQTANGINPTLWAANLVQVAPTAPTNLRTTGKTTTSVALAWDASTEEYLDVTGYNVYRGAALVGTNVAVLTYNDTGLTTATQYAYTVKARDAVGNLGVATAVLNVTTN